MVASIKKRAYLSIVFVSLPLLGLLIPPVLSAQGAVIVYINGPIQAAENADILVIVNTTELANFNAANYDVIYDPNVLEAGNVTDGLINGTTIPVDMWRVITSGTIRVIQNVPRLTGVSGSGYLAEIQFHVIGSAGSSSVISFANGVLSDNDANEIPAIWVGNSVLIYALTPTPTPTPAPTTTLTLTPTPTPTPTSPPIGGGGGYIPISTLAPQPTRTPMATPTPMYSLISIGITTKSEGSLGIGETQQLTAIATYSDGSSVDVTDQATWFSYDSGVATVNGVGLVIGLGAGTVVISTTLDGKSGRFILIVTPTPTPTLTPTPTPIPTPTATPRPTPTATYTPTPTPTAAAISSSLNGWIIGAVVAAGAAAGAIAVLYVQRRRTRRQIH
jgi:hypothetical protein